MGLTLHSCRPCSDGVCAGTLHLEVHGLQCRHYTSSSLKENGGGAEHHMLQFSHQLPEVLCCRGVFLF